MNNLKSVADKRKVKCIVIVGGGDGTIPWVIQEM